MPLESATYISDLNTSNPVGSTDKVQTLDDHVRLIKSTLKTTFPNVNGAMTSSDEELNILDGATLSTAELNILDGVTLTAAQINEAARLSANNTFTGSVQRIYGANGSIRIKDTGGTADRRIAELLIVANSLRGRLHNDAEDFNVTWLDVAIGAGPAATTIGLAASTEIDLTATTLDFNGNLDVSGTLTTPNASASEVGFKGTPQNAQNGDYTLVLTDAGKTIYKSAGGAGETITIPANGTVAFPVGTIIRVVNNGGGTLTIAITSDTLTLAGLGTTGSRTLADDSVAVIEKVASTEWFISGVGLS